jgi:hypothetical protein
MPGQVPILPVTQSVTRRGAATVIALGRPPLPGQSPEHQVRIGNGWLCSVAALREALRAVAPGLSGYPATVPGPAGKQDPLWHSGCVPVGDQIFEHPPRMPVIIWPGESYVIRLGESCLDRARVK